MNIFFLIILGIAESYQADLPYIEDAKRLPPREELQVLRQIAVDYSRELKQHRERFPGSPHDDDYAAAVQECEWLVLWYGYALDATSPFYFEVTRRQALAALVRLSPELYYSGGLPPCVPYWRLKQCP